MSQTAELANFLGSFKLNQIDAITRDAAYVADKAQKDGFATGYKVTFSAKGEPSISLDHSEPLGLTDKGIKFLEENVYYRTYFKALGSRLGLC